METSFESRQGQLKYSDTEIYNFLSNFNNFKKFIPEDKIKDFESSEDHCRFSVPNIGEIGLRIIEREPVKLIKITGDGMANQKFTFWMQIKKIELNDTRIKFTIKADLNPMLKMMVNKPLQGFLDKLVDSMEQMNFR